MNSKIISKKDTYTFSIENKNDIIKIKINGLIHIILYKNKLIGIQSWIPENPHDKFCIEFTFKSNVLLSEYDTLEKWKNVLELIDTIF